MWEASYRSDSGGFVADGSADMWKRKIVGTPTPKSHKKEWKKREKRAFFAR
jgi:hypothetical protein